MEETHVGPFEKLNKADLVRLGRTPLLCARCCGFSVPLACWDGRLLCANLTAGLAPTPASPGGRGIGSSLAVTMAITPTYCSSSCGLISETRDRVMSLVFTAGDSTSSGSEVRDTVGWAASRSPSAHRGHPAARGWHGWGYSASWGSSFRVAHTILAEKQRGIVWSCHHRAIQRA